MVKSGRSMLVERDLFAHADRARRPHILKGPGPSHDRVTRCYLVTGDAAAVNQAAPAGADVHLAEA